MIVADSSVVIETLVGSGDPSPWAEEVVVASPLAAPHLMPVEVANILRRSVAAGELTSDTAALAHADLLSMPIELLPYAPCASRVWELRSNVTSYDAWYIALAEILDAPLATLDERLARSPGPRCEFLLPPPNA
ncbi:type II toxin-antitoxin system VapC family toxin [Solicola gregarius]|uniref:Ribonuclease VapC n=1 Tax=Solicola gregarius TaxID=2908642 RepID=A0AA46TF91_9ACTN|nr:type II toxin-antitoxin system VapC family toxin [Solicola gregarius]UYM03488.1 type II toxin-antitoxin system VapC family toxin [Solicola gregarius]